MDVTVFFQSPKNLEVVRRMTFANARHLRKVGVACKVVGCVRLSKMEVLNVLPELLLYLKIAKRSSRSYRCPT